MNWLPDARVGDVFRWRGDSKLYKIIGEKDCDIYFHHLDEKGRDIGKWGYTTLPQDVEIVDAITLLGLLGG